MAVDPLELALLDEARMLKFYKKILRTERANLLACWPLWEASGSVAYDISGNGRNGSHVAVTLGQPGIGDGRTCPLYDGSTSYTNVYSAALAAAFNGAEGTLLVWVQVASAGVWTDGVIPYTAVHIGADANNYVEVMHYPANTLRWQYGAGGTIKTINLGSLSTLAFMCTALTWSASGDKAIAYYNGAQTGATRTGLGTFVGSLAASATLLGAIATTPSWLWSGTLAHCALWSKALTPAQVKYVSVV